MSKIELNVDFVIMLSTFHPFKDDTGPNTSIKSLIEEFGKDFSFIVISSENYFTDEFQSDWGEYYETPIYYLKNKPFGALYDLTEALRKIEYKAIILSSFFDPKLSITTLVLRKLGIIPKKPIIISPRGEFSKAALSIKPNKKNFYLRIANVFGLLKDAWIHATSSYEVTDIKNVLHSHRKIIQASDTIPQISDPINVTLPQNDLGGSLNLVFLGRISRIKNIDFAIEVIKKISFPVNFFVIGPLQDEEYWENECEPIVRELPSHVFVERKGPLPHNQIIETISKHDLFFLPSKSESFGHAIFEALTAGVPVLTSDQTPWRGLTAAQAGWDLPLDRPEAFVDVIHDWATWPDERKLAFRKGAQALARAHREAHDPLAETRAMFEKVLRESASRDGPHPVE